MYFDFKLVTSILAPTWNAQNDGPERAGVPGVGTGLLQGGVLQSHRASPSCGRPQQHLADSREGEQLEASRKSWETFCRHQEDLVARYDMNQLKKKLQDQQLSLLKPCKNPAKKEEEAYVTKHRYVWNKILYVYLNTQLCLYKFYISTCMYKNQFWVF